MRGCFRSQEVDTGTWRVSFLDYDLGYIDLEEDTLAAPRQPLRAKSVAQVLGTSVTHVSVPDPEFLEPAEGFEPPTL